MIAVIFEVQPQDGQLLRYLELAAGLKAELEQIDGFVSVERFESLSRPGHYLSLSLWRDEAAVQAWRRHAQHREAQQLGRDGLLAGYRLRVASVLRDYGLETRDEAPPDSQAALR